MFVILDEYFLAGEVMETSKTQVFTRRQPLVISFRVFCMCAHNSCTRQYLCIHVCDKTHVCYICIRVCVRVRHAGAPARSVRIREPRRARMKELRYDVTRRRLA